MEPLQIETNTIEKAMLCRASAAQRPITGTLELLPICNMNCDMCYIRLSRTEMEKKGRMRTADEWISMGEEMERAGVLFFCLQAVSRCFFRTFAGCICH